MTATSVIQSIIVIPSPERLPLVSHSGHTVIVERTADRATLLV
jgi:hypothetical protein